MDYRDEKNVELAKLYARASKYRETTAYKCESCTCLRSFGRVVKPNPRYCSNCKRVTESVPR